MTGFTNSVIRHRNFRHEKRPSYLSVTFPFRQWSSFSTGVTHCPTLGYNRPTHREELSHQVNLYSPTLLLGVTSKVSDVSRVLYVSRVTRILWPLVMLFQITWSVWRITTYSGKLLFAYMVTIWGGKSWNLVPRFVGTGVGKKPFLVSWPFMDLGACIKPFKNLLRNVIV